MSSDPLPTTICAYATLRIAGDDLHPEQFTDVIGLQPSEAWRKGESITVGKSGRSSRKQSGMWIYRTSDAVPGHDLAKHLSFLADELGYRENEPCHSAKSVQIKNLIDAANLRPAVSIFWHGSAGAAAPAIPNDFVDLIRFLGGRVLTDFATDEPEANAYPMSRRSV